MSFLALFAELICGLVAVSDGFLFVLCGGLGSAAVGRGGVFLCGGVEDEPLAGAVDGEVVFPDRALEDEAGAGTMDGYFFFPDGNLEDEPRTGTLDGGAEGSTTAVLLFEDRFREALEHTPDGPATPAI